jgi:hypothetical protein
VEKTKKKAYAFLFLFFCFFWVVGSYIFGGSLVVCGAAKAEAQVYFSRVLEIF